MKKLLYILILLGTISICFAQNKSTEAKMAFQLAEESFEAKDYTKALDFLSKAEKALGKTNPPIAYLRVMIIDEISIATQKTADGGKHLESLERAVEDFDTVEGKDALGNDKLLQVYRVKMNIEEKKKEFAVYFEQFEKEQKVIHIANAILEDLPKVGESARILEDSRFSTNFSSSSLNKLYKTGYRWFAFPVKTMKVGDNAFEYIQLADNKIDNYKFWRNIDVQPQKNKITTITKDQLIDYFGLHGFEKFVFFNQVNSFTFLYKSENIDLFFTFEPEVRIIKNSEGQYSTFLVANVFRTRY